LIIPHWNYGLVRIDRQEEIMEMEENDIRPQYLMKENARLRAEDRQVVLKYRNEFVEVACPACESDDYKVAFEKDGFTFVECVKCETVFINPRPTSEILGTFYATSKAWNHFNEKIFPESENARRSKIIAPRARMVVDFCRKYGVKSGVLVDVGAGFGTFCEEIQKLSVFEKVIAVEPARGLAETCRKKGLEVIEKSIEDVQLEHVNVFTSYELIEHLFLPKDFLLACGRALPKGGLFILTTPNIKGFDLMVLGKISDNISGPGHLNYFHPESLRYLLESCGFEVIETLTPGQLDVDIVRNKMLSGEFDVSGFPFLKYILIDQSATLRNAFQKFLMEHKLSSSLWMVARKI
jgi:2-polyprenyl-3-methyl-5-hydroxy-6-metoxy-1,4-benzoquinol methylase